MTLLDIEEKFDITIESYFDYERARLDLALRHMLTWDLSHATLAADIRIINRHLLSLLSTGKLYVDQLNHDFATLYGRQSPQWGLVEEKRRLLHSESLGYQVAAVLRNHIQHRGLPVNTLYYQKTARNEDGQRRFQAGADPYLDVYELQKDRAVSKELLNRLKELGHRVPVTPLIKDYLGCLGELHKKVREITSTDGCAWESDLRALLSRAETAFGRVPVVAVVELLEDGSHGEEHQVFEELLELRPALLRKNAFLSNLAQWFVSTENASRDT
jgi:hypothetical protein